MLQQKDNNKPIKLYGFLVGVEVVEGGTTTPEQVALRLAESLSFMEGLGEVDVENLGEIQQLDETVNIEGKTE